MLELRSIALLACLAAVAYLGWQASSWRAQAGRAEALSAQLRDETRGRIEATQTARRLQANVIALELDLAEVRDNLGTSTQVRRVIQYVPKMVDCDLPDEPVGLLNRARAGLPLAGGPDGTGAATGSP